MAKRIKMLDELKDSQIMFDKEPPAFCYILIIIILIFGAAVLCWSYRTPKMYTIQAHGVVASEKASYVMCAQTGEVFDCNMVEGQLVDEGDVLFSIKSTDYDLQMEQLEANRIIYETKIEKNELLVKSIKDDVNYFDETNPEDSLYFNAFEAYKSRVAQSSLDTSVYAAYGYSEEQIQNEIEKNQGKSAEIYYSAIQEAEANQEEAKQQVSAIDAQLTAINSGKETYDVVAPTSGTLHLLAQYKNGMVVQTAQAVATISPSNEANIIEAYVTTADMARISEEDTVQIVIDGLPQNVYGTIPGKVKQIDSNITIQELGDGTKEQSFRVLVSMDKEYVVANDGDKVDIKNGMTAVARISYDKVTYFNYVLEKMGIKVRK